METINVDSNLVLLAVAMLGGVMMAAVLAMFIFAKVKTKTKNEG